MGVQVLEQITPPRGLSVSIMGVPYDSIFNHLGFKAAHAGSSMTQSHLVLGPVLGKTKARAPVLRVPA